MKRFGSTHADAKKMDETQLFLMKLHLLIVMVKAKLKGYPTGDFRKEAVLENTASLFKTLPHLNIGILGPNISSHLFKERVKLLSVMAIAIISKDYPLGIHRREAVLDNMENIIKSVFPRQKISLFHEVLMAA
ncbi:MAG: hypothetical protein KKC20_08480 [Proteobacteria bacterium]|nr:hypothetical protein [Pseudomonadota bacterium]